MLNFEYDSNENQAKVRGYDGNGELSGGNETKQNEYNVNGELTSYRVYFYKKV